MKKSTIVISHLFQLVLFFFILYATASCVFHSEGIQISMEKFNDCSTGVSNCKKKNEVLDVKFSGVSIYKTVPDLWEDKLKTYELYHDSNISISNIEMPEIKGSLLIQTSYIDWDKNMSDFVEITLLNDTDNFFIAYSKVKDECKPEWLTTYYTPVINPHTVPPRPYYITSNHVTLSSSGKWIYDNFLEIWQIKPEFYPKRNKPFPIPGNVNALPSNPACVGIRPAMYVVIVKPKVDIDCSNGVELARHATEGCFYDLAKAKEKAQQDCRDTLPISFTTPFQCLDDTVCDSLLGMCPCTGAPGENCTIYGSGGFSLKVEARSFLYNSEIEFDPLKYKSMADIILWLPGKRQDFNNQAVKGNLHFEYQYQINDMKLNSMKLEINSLDTDAGKFEDIIITQWKFAKATCKDTMPVYHQPCTQYDISQGDLVVGLSAKLNGKSLLFAGTNQNVIHMTIDHPTRTFNFQGPLHTTVNINGQDTPLDISVDLTGHFVNFAPKAFGRESTRTVECGLSRAGNRMTSGNKDPVILDSSGSFEIYETWVTNPPIYEWYEDFGLVTEKLWGKGSKYTIAPYYLGYGVHSFTLVVKDKNGLVDTDTFDIDVRDTIPPELTVPSDIIIFQSPDDKGSAKLDIGQAQAYDSCSDKVMISNDAPKDMLFPPGDTTVTWKADDGKGNVTTKVQKVSVGSFIGSVGDLIWSSSLNLMEITNKSMNAIEECKANPKCMIDFEPLISALEGFIGRLKETSVADDKELLRRQVISKLEPALIDLKEAHDFSKRSNEGENMRKMELRNSALTKLRDVRNSMAEVSNISRALQ